MRGMDSLSCSIFFHSITVKFIHIHTFFFLFFKWKACELHSVRTGDKYSVQPLHHSLHFSAHGPIIPTRRITEINICHPPTCYSPRIATWCLMMVGFSYTITALSWPIDCPPCQFFAVVWVTLRWSCLPWPGNVWEQKSTQICSTDWLRVYEMAVT